MLALLLYGYGYEQGGGDQTELICLIKATQHPSLYPVDAFVRGYQDHQPHFRTVSSLLPMILPFSWENSVWILYVISAFGLLLGLERIASVWIQSLGLRILLLFVFLYQYSHWKIGYHDLYYPGYIASLTGSAIAGWSVYVFLCKRRMYAYLLLGLATIVHGPSGWVLFPVFLLIDLADLTQGKINVRSFISASLPYWFTGFAFTVLIVLKNKSGDSKDLFEWYVLLRNPHHYLISHTRLLSVIMNVLVILSGVWLAYSFRFLRRLLSVFGSGLVVLVAYVLCVEVMHSGMIAMTQFWILDTWLYFLGWLCIFAVAEKLIPWEKDSFRMQVGGVVCAFLLMVWVGPLSGKSFPWFNQYNTSPRMHELSSAYSFIRCQTDTQSLFIYPPSLSSFKSLSERSSFVDLKAVIPRADWMKNWWKKLQILYPEISTKSPPSFQNSQAYWEPAFQKLSMHELESVKQAGVTHAMVYSGMKFDFPTVFEGDYYVIYSLDSNQHDNQPIK